ncbi:MAG: SusC/RagA family TonB-linked outer membrane protein [Bacteroidales bacterium]|nr:SusC/RagA family TonB-linked outer membrane protein [Bacteroidales bacterium]
MINKRPINYVIRNTFFLLISLIWTNTLFGQDSILVKGIITGESGTPVSEVSVSIEGVQVIPAISDTSGYFEIICPKVDLWLLIEPISGYKSKRIYLNNRNQLKIQLSPVDRKSGYDEVGNLFRPELKRNILSASNVPDQDRSARMPVKSIDQSFQGSIPGLWATTQNGMSNSETSTYIRGIRSMYTSHQPLYIVDGQPMEEPGIFQSNISGYDYNPIASIDPMDITNITILKDYLGGAIYGMKGSNGVILIETLKPSEVQTTIDFSYRIGVSTPPTNIPQLNSMQYKTLANEILASSGRYEEDYKEEYFPLFTTENDPEYYKYNKNTNWQNEIFGNAIMHDYYLRIKGGDEVARYGLSVGYMNHEGIVKKTNLDRFNVRFVGSFNVVRWLSMYVSSTLISSTSSLKESALSPITSPILTSFFKAPILYPYQYDENGKELNDLENVNSLGVSNPLAVINNFEGEQKNYRFANSLRAEVKIFQDYLKWTSLVGITFNSLQESVFMPNKGMELYYDEEVYNVSKSLKNYLSTVYSDNYLSYKQEFNNKHIITGAAGMRVYKNIFEIDWGIGKNSHISDEYKQLQNGVSYLREMGGENSAWNRMGFYTGAGYSFRNKYYLNANLSTEFSSRTGINAKDVLKISGYPFGLFYSFGAAWRISDESFLKHLYWLEDLKLRASYGKVGNDDIGNLSAINYYTVEHYRGTSGMIPGNISDQSLKFEINRQLNTGLDLSMFGNRLFIGLDIYSTKTEDMLVFEPQPTYTGVSFVPANNGEITNNGWEIGFNSRVISQRKFKWDLGINIAGLKNTVNVIKDGAVVTPFEGGQFITMVGEPVLNFYGYQFEGVFSSRQEALDAGLVNERGISFGAGDAKYTDFSGPNGTPDSVINEYDMTILGSPIPNLFGGLRNTFSYGRWSLSADFQLVLGRDVFNYLRFQNEKMTDLSNQSTSIQGRWTHDGQITDIPRALYNDPIGNSDFSSRWIEDGSYIRLKHLTLSYTVAQEIWLFRNLEILVTATNLYTWSKYLGFDPEFSYSNNTMEMGIDYGMVPQTRRFLLGFKVGL